MRQDDGTPLLATREAAHLLGVAAPTLVRWRCRGTGPPFARLGYLVRYRKDDITAFIVERMVTPRRTSSLPEADRRQTPIDEFVRSPTEGVPAPKGAGG